MYLKNDKIVATIDNIIMRSSKIGGPQEFVLDPTAITGWTDGTAVRRDATQHANSNGDFPEKAKMSSRIITFSGTAVAATIADLQIMRDKLTGLLVDGDYKTLSVETKSGIRYATVGLEGTTSWVQQADTVAVWNLTLYSPDACIYGTEKIETVGAYVVQGGIEFPLSYPMNYNLLGADVAPIIRNNGNTHSWPVFRVTGEYYDGFTISDNKSNEVSYSGMVTKQSPVYIDMAKGTAIQNGVDRTTLVTKRQWFSIPANSAVRPEFRPTLNGSGWCDIIYRDTWI